MKQTQKIISTYTADVSGVCSALYELEGMTVMHDASGCNSTYNTHDEPRWYDSPSLVFISGLTETEAIMGDDEKLVRDITETAKELKPRFIAIAGSPVPMMTGCDIPAIARETEALTGIPSFGFQTSGMHSYVSGAGEALEAYIDRFAERKEKKKRSANILGVTPVDFSVNGQNESMKTFLIENGWEVISTVAQGSSRQEIALTAQAEVNLVVSSVGLKTARLLYRKFGTPYVIGTPYGKEFGNRLVRMMEKSSETGENAVGFGDFAGFGDVFIIGECVTSRSLAMAINLKYGKEVRVICPLEMSEGLLSTGDYALSEEEDIENALKNASAVIADPLYKPIVPKSAKFFALPHEGFSGRLYRKNIPDLIKGI